IAKKYGVVVWAREPVAGIAELEARVKAVDDAFREAGAELDQLDSAAPNVGSQRGLMSELAPFLLKTIIVTILIGVLFVAISLAALGALSSPASRIISTIKHPAKTMVALADKIDQASPERIEEWKLAIHKIVTKLSPLVDEIWPANNPQQAIPPK